MLFFSIFLLSMKNKMYQFPQKYEAAQLASMYNVTLIIIINVSLADTYYIVSNESNRSSSSL